MNLLRMLLASVLFAAAPTHAQNATPAEITFWESVRNSRNSAELEAYLQTYPNGVYAALARARLAALSGKAAPQIATAAPSNVASATRAPQVGDVWTYRASHPRLRGEFGKPQRPPSIHVVRVSAIDGTRVVDQVSIDGGAPITTTHDAAVGYLVPQGMSLFSPYLLAFRDIPEAGSVGDIAVLDTPCTGNGQYSCRANGRIRGRENIQVGADKFMAYRVTIDEDWRPARGGAYNVHTQMTGGRTLTVWYVPELRRAVKYSSRPTVGDVPPIEPNFDLELISYDLK